MDWKQAVLDGVTLIIGGSLAFWGQSRVRQQLVTSSELDEKLTIRKMKRDAYAGLIASIEELYEADLAKDNIRADRAEQEMNRALSIIDLIAPYSIYFQAGWSSDYATLHRTDPIRMMFISDLYSAMRSDLETPIPTFQFDPGKNFLH